MKAWRWSQLGRGCSNIWPGSRETSFNHARCSALREFASSKSSLHVPSEHLEGSTAAKANWPTSWPKVQVAAVSIPRRLHLQCLDVLGLRNGRLISCVGPLRSRGFASSSSVHEILANHDIPFPKVRVVDDAGLVGDFKIGEALSLATQRSTDLVVLSGEVQPPLCRLVSLETYIEELDRKAADKEQQKRARRLREFSFDPAMKVKGMRFTALIDEHDLERKVNQVRSFLEKGHRVEARILQSRAVPEDVLDLALRIIAEVRDIAKPEYLEESIRELQMAINSPKSLKRRGRAPPDELRIRLWPCTPEQAAAFQLPAHIVGPRRRRGPAIVGIDDGEQDEFAWKLNRKPHPRKKGATKADLRREVFDE